jgi:hypothetical protein
MEAKVEPQLHRIDEEARVAAMDDDGGQAQ